MDPDTWPIIKGTLIVLLLIASYFWQDPAMAIYLAAGVVATVIYLCWQQERKRERETRDDPRHDR